MLQALDSVMKEACSKTAWGEKNEISHSIEDGIKTLEADLDALNKQAHIYQTHDDAGDMTRETVEFMRGWHVSGHSPSLVSMAVASCEAFNIQKPDNRQALLIAAVLGDVPNDLPYHNNLHFKKVMLQLIRLIAVHNGIYKGTARELAEDDIALMLIGGCIHDLGHDGMGNTVKGVFYAGRLERQSYEYAEPYLMAAGIDEGALQKLKTIILTTDVTPLGDVTNAMNQMKAAFRFHFLGENEQFHTLNLSQELDALEQDKKAAIMACLLHEADIATSAGLSYEATQFETCKLMEEIGTAEAKPSHIVDFLEKVCQRRFLSEAGQKLFGANCARIYALAQEQESGGNEAFPEAAHTDFILGHAVYNETSKTLN